MTFDEWWDSNEKHATPDTYKGWEESCRQAWQSAITSRTSKINPVAAQSLVIARANKLAANSNFHITGFEAHKMGNLVQALLEYVEQHTEES